MTKKTVLITGCSAGSIGDALARTFHTRGLVVFATARSSAKMAGLAELGIETFELDVTSEASIAAAAAKVRAHPAVTGHGLDILVNNAGVNHVLPFADCTTADLRRVLDTNLLGSLVVTHALLPLLVAARGTVATIGSINQVFCPPYQTAYNASKAALAAANATLRIELAPLGVRVVTVMTGSVRSLLFENQEQASRVPDGSWYAPLKERIEGRDFLDGVKWTPAEVYAEQVVGDLLGRPAPVIWRGAMAFIARLIGAIAWPGMLDSAMMKGVGLSTLKPPETAVTIGGTTAESVGDDGGKSDQARGVT